MQVDVLANFVRSRMKQGNYTHVEWDGELMDEQKFVAEARKIIYCEPPQDLTDCINDVVEQVKFLTAEQVQKIQFGELEKPNALLEFKAQWVFENMCYHIAPLADMGFTSYFNAYVTLVSALDDWEEKGSEEATMPSWPAGLSLYVEIDRQDYIERFYELRYRYANFTEALWSLKRNPEALAWLINGKGLEDV